LNGDLQIDAKLSEVHAHSFWQFPVRYDVCNSAWSGQIHLVPRTHHCTRSRGCLVVARQVLEVQPQVDVAEHFTKALGASIEQYIEAAINRANEQLAIIGLSIAVLLGRPVRHGIGFATFQSVDQAFEYLGWDVRSINGAHEFKQLQGARFRLSRPTP
jgi:hypothetical protein